MTGRLGHSTVSARADRPTIRNGLLVISLVVLAGLCLRSALVAADANGNWPLARAVWPTHPDELRAEILLGLAQAARDRQPISPHVAADIRLLSKRAPLDPEPFSAEGAIALRTGEYPRAERLLVE